MSVSSQKARNEARIKPTISTRVCSNGHRSVLLTKYGVSVPHQLPFTDANDNSISVLYNVIPLPRSFDRAVDALALTYNYIFLIKEYSYTFKSYAQSQACVDTRQCSYNYQQQSAVFPAQC